MSRAEARFAAPRRGEAGRLYELYLVPCLGLFLVLIGLPPWANHGSWVGAALVLLGLALLGWTLAVVVRGWLTGRDRDPGRAEPKGGAAGNSVARAKRGDDG